jgi:hypothetical protein
MTPILISKTSRFECISRLIKVTDLNINCVFLYEIYVVQNMFVATIFICKQSLANFITVKNVAKKTTNPKKCHYKLKLRHLLMTPVMLKRLLSTSEFFTD